MLNNLAKELMILRTLCVLIALSMGMLSPVLANAAQSGSELATSEFALPDGTPQVICFGNGGGKTDNTVHCDDCLLGNITFTNLTTSTGIPLPLVVKIGNITTNIQPDNLHDFLKRQQSRAPPLI